MLCDLAVKAGLGRWVHQTPQDRADLWHYEDPTGRNVTTRLGDGVMRWAGVSTSSAYLDDDVRHLVRANDVSRMSFEDIADLIRTALPYASEAGGAGTAPNP